MKRRQALCAQRELDVILLAQSNQRPAREVLKLQALVSGMTGRFVC
jgi:hypothetical protein